MRVPDIPDFQTVSETTLESTLRNFFVHLYQIFQHSSPVLTVQRYVRGWRVRQLTQDPYHSDIRFPWIYFLSSAKERLIQIVAPDLIDVRRIESRILPSGYQTSNPSDDEPSLRYLTIARTASHSADRQQVWSTAQKLGYPELQWRSAGLNDEGPVVSRHPLLSMLFTQPSIQKSLLRRRQGHFKRHNQPLRRALVCIYFPQSQVEYQTLRRLCHDHKWMTPFSQLEHDVAAMRIQRTWRHVQERHHDWIMTIMTKRLLIQRASICIQRYWRYYTGLSTRLRFCARMKMMQPHHDHHRSNIRYIETSLYDLAMKGMLDSIISTSSVWTYFWTIRILASPSGNLRLMTGSSSSPTRVFSNAILSKVMMNTNSNVHASQGTYEAIQSLLSFHVQPNLDLDTRWVELEFASAEEAHVRETLLYAMTWNRTLSSGWTLCSTPRLNKNFSGSIWDVHLAQPFWSARRKHKDKFDETLEEQRKTPMTARRRRPRGPELAQKKWTCSKSKGHPQALLHRPIRPFQYSHQNQDFHGSTADDIRSWASCSTTTGELGSMSGSQDGPKQEQFHPQEGAKKSQSHRIPKNLPEEPKPLSKTLQDVPKPFSKTPQEVPTQSHRIPKNLPEVPKPLSKTLQEEVPKQSSHHRISKQEETKKSSKLCSSYPCQPPPRGIRYPVRISMHHHHHRRRVFKNQTIASSGTTEDRKSKFEPRKSTSRQNQDDRAFARIFRRKTSSLGRKLSKQRWKEEKHKLVEVQKDRTDIERQKESEVRDGLAMYYTKKEQWNRQQKQEHQDYIMKQLEWATILNEKRQVDQQARQSR